MGDRYDENKDRNNFFLNSDELGKIANTLKNSFSDSVREVMDIINEKQTPSGDLIPVRNKRLVEQKPKEIKDSKSKATTYTILSFSSLATGLIVIASEIADSMDITAIVMGIIFIVGGGLLNRAGKIQKNKALVMERYNKYLRGFGSGTICNLDELAKIANVDEATVLKDLSYYIQKDYLKEARIVDGAIMLDNETYNAYKKIPKYQHNELIKDTKTDNKYLTELLNFHNSIDEPVKSDVKELLLIVEKIYKNAKENPQDLEQIEKFKEYYLPSVIKLLGEYEKIQKSDINSAKVMELKGDIESSIKIINEAFRNLLEDLYEDDVIDIKTDISVLKSMLYQEGLLDRM